MNYVGGLLGFSLGDAFASPVDGFKREDLLEKPITKMVDDDRFLLDVGTWSDNTSLIVATIDSINAKCTFDLDDIMNKFIIYKQHAEFTPSKEVVNLDKTVAKAIDRYNEDKDVDACGDVDSLSNGSLKRILPISYYALETHLKDLEVLKLTKDVSSLTHSSPVCEMACYFFVRYTMFLLNGKDKLAAYNMARAVDYTSFGEDVVSKFDRLLKNDISKVNVKDIKSSDNVIDTLETCIWVFLNTDNYKDALVGATNLGGSTATISALTGALAGILYGEDSLEEEWLNKLIKKDYLIDCFEEFSENKYLK